MRRTALAIGFSAVCACSSTSPATSAATTSASSNPSASSSCVQFLPGLFTPLHPQRGRYEVCAAVEPLDIVAKQWERPWTIEALGPLDAFGAAGVYDRSAVARLYGGRRATVARTWIEEDGRFEALTLISPHPDRTLRELRPGTLIIRYIVFAPDRP